MPPQPARILLTRPADQGARFAQDLRTRFAGRVDMLQSPLLAVRFKVPALPAGPFSAVVFTSENAVAAAQPLCPFLPPRAYAVGDRTAAAARAAGFHTQSAQGDAAALVALLTAADPGPVLHLHGAETRGEVVPRLQAAGLQAAGAIVYVQEPQALSGQALAWLADARPVIAPLFSPRTASLFSAAAAEARAPLWLASLSPAVDSAAACPAEHRRIAARPDAASLLAELSILVDSATSP
jgi:uroporphyrinogen-III synthase